MTITDQIISINNAKHDELAELHRLQAELRTVKLIELQNTEKIEDLELQIQQIAFTINGLEQSIKTLKALQALAFIMKEAD